MELLIYLAKSVGILSVFYLVYYLVLRKDTFFTANRHYLLSGIFAAITLPFLSITQVTYIEVPTRELATTPIEALNMFPMTESVLQPETFTIDWWQIALLVYLGGIIILGLRFASRLFSLLNLLRKYPFQKKGRYRFVQVPETVSPFSFFQYIVYNPRLHAQEELQMILEHEKIHATQWHSIDILLANCISILQWVNPLSWQYKKRLEENLEFIADNGTVQQLPSKKEYQLALVKASSALYAPALTTQFYQSFIKKRIIMLNKSNSNKYNQLKLSLVFPLLAIFLWGFNVNEVVEYTETPVASEILVTDIQAETTTAIATNLAETPTPKETAATIAIPTPKKEITVAKPLENLATPFQDPAPRESIVENSTLAQSFGKPLKEFQIKVTKNTTDAELDKMKAELKKDHGIDMSYKAIRNANSEIISISISYRDKNGNSGQYEVNDDDAPIQDFHFYLNADGDRGFWSEAHEAHRVKRTEKQTERMEERHKEMEERRGEMEVRSQEMHERQAVMEQEMEVHRHEMHERAEEMEQEMTERRKEMEERSNDMAKRMEREQEKVHKRQNSQRVYVSQGVKRTHVSQGSEHSILLDKDTSDATLAKMKKNLAAKGISFSYSKLRRNSQGEITRIRVEVDNGKGSEQSVFSKKDDDQPIDEMIIEM